jgi:hypothetical protein
MTAAAMKLRQGSCLTPIEHQLAGDEWNVTIGPGEGSYAGMPDQRAYEIRVYDLPPGITRISVNGKVINVKSERTESTTPYWWYDSSIMGPTICVPSTKRSEKVQVSIHQPFGDGSMVEAMMGFRGAARALCQANEISQITLLGGIYDCDKLDFVFSALQDVPDAGEAIRQWRIRWGDYVKKEVKSPSSAADQVKILLRLLGLYYKARINITSPDSRFIFADVLVGSVLPIPALRDVNVIVQLLPMPGWTRVGPSQWDAQGPTEASPLLATATLESPDPIDTMVFRAALSIRSEVLELGMAFPIEVILLPSINRWHILGPFDRPGAQGLAKVFPPESKIDFTATYDGKDGKKTGWRTYRRIVNPGDDLTSEFLVDFDDVFGKRVNDAVVYGFVYLDAAQDVDATLALGSDDGVAIWLNGKEIYRNDIRRSYSSKSDLVPAHLKQGRNTLLVKVSQGGGDGGFCVHVQDDQGKPLTSVKARLE